MTPDDMKAVLARFYAMWEGNSQIDPADVCAAEYLDHNPHPGPPGLEGVKKAVRTFRTAFPDSRCTSDLMLVDGDKVAGRSQFAGTHLGPLGDIPPTGKRVEMDTLDIARIVDGKIAEIWHLEDVMKMMEQIGVMPPAKET